MTSSPQIVAEIGIVLYPDVQLAAVHGLTDLFRIAGFLAANRKPDAPPAIRVSHWAPGGADGAITCSDDSHPGAPHRLTHLVVPPSLVMPGEIRGIEAVAQWLKARHDEGATLCSICAGAFVIAQTGLLEGRSATTHWAFADVLARLFPGVRIEAERMVIDEGDVITAGGLLAWTDLGLTLVERMMGPALMLDTARFLLIDPPGREQRPYSHFLPRFDHGDAAILKVQHMLHATRAKQASAADMAAEAGLEERTFLRRFQKATGLRPLEYAQQVRIAKAREDLELTRRPVEQIAWDVGYGDPSAFRKLFHRITGLAPHEYRKRFGVARPRKSDDGASPE